VRYISHELRTPLNTAFLGLKLLSSDLKASNDPKDIERYDTLCDVNMSCMAAVDILNDLLCYEKLESGILELHKENILVESLLVGCLTMFSGQARECGVTMTVTMDGTYRNRDLTAYPSTEIISLSLQPHDSIYADKFKMDQVIRNLMSNALKFTPRGGSVTINASFVHDNDDELLLIGPNACAEPHIDANLGEEVNGQGERKPKIKRRRRRDSRPVSRSLKVGPDTVQSESDAGTSEGVISGKLIIVVKDTGAGISKENQKRLFNEIVQFNPEKLQAGGGSGLGLWITQEILNLHDGSISVSSEGEGMGSSFTIEIPMLRHSVAPPSFTETRPSSLVSAIVRLDTRDETDGSETRAPGLFLGDQSLSVQSLNGDPTNFMPKCSSPLEVLVVDDSRLNRKMLLKCLQADGHRCIEAADGLEAIAMVEERIGHATGGNGKPFDAILMDFIMPNMDGPTATKEIRALGYTAPIFGVTGNGESVFVHLSYIGCNRILDQLSTLSMPMTWS
jgi:signal transduction histidine kinase